MKQGCTFIQGSTFLYWEFFKYKNCTWENRNISLPIFQKRKSCYFKKTTTIWRVHWLIKSRVGRKQLKNLLSPWSSFTARLLGCLTNLCHEVGPRAGPHQAWDHHLQDHMNQDYSRYPARKEEWDTAASMIFHLPCHHKKFCYVFIAHTSNVSSSPSPHRWGPALFETIYTNNNHHTSANMTQ